MTTNIQHLEESAAILPIKASARQLADRYASEHPNPIRAEQIRRNTLAVNIVSNYFQMFGITTDPNASESNKLIDRLCDDVADLVVLGVGRLECRPTLPDSTTCYVPSNTWEDRKAFIIVCLDEPNREATILGFITEVTTEEIPLISLQPIDDLFDVLVNAQTAPLSPWRQPIFISEWLVKTGSAALDAMDKTLQNVRNVTDSFADLNNEWEVLQNFLGLNLSSVGLSPTRDLRLREIPTEVNERLSQADDDPDNVDKQLIAVESLANSIISADVLASQRWNCVIELNKRQPDHPMIGTSREIKIPLDDRILALTVAIIQRSDRVVCFCLRVHPADNLPNLPADIVLSIFDDEGKEIKHIAASPNESAFRYEDLEVEPDTRFVLRLSRGELYEEFPFEV